MIKHIIITLLFASCLFANGKSTAIDQRIMDLSMNYEFEEADKLLAAEFSINESLKNHFLYLSIEMMKVMKTADEVPFSKRRETKNIMNQVLIDYAEEIIEKYEDEELSINQKFYFGSINGFLGRLYGVNKSWMSAFSYGKEGRNIMLDIIEEDSSFTDAYLLVGMMNYYADRMGGVTEFIASILGLSGDRIIGLEYLNKVDREGHINSWQATMILIELYSRMEGNKFEAIPLLEKMVKQFPNNSKFVNWLCYEYMNLQDFNRAGKMIVNDNENKINEFVKASYFSGIGKYEKSNEIYSITLNEEDNTWPWVYENAKFTRALNYFFMNDSVNAGKYSKELNEMYSSELDLINKNKKLVKELQNFEIAVNTNNNVAVEEYLSGEKRNIESASLNSEFYFYKAVYKFKNNNYNEAEELFLKSKNISPDDYGERASRYLIHIYKTNTFEIEKIEALLDDIDEYDNVGLEFFAQDLEEKYEL